MKPGDLDGDGDLDLVASSHNDPSGLSILWNDGRGGLSGPQVYGNIVAYGIVPADLDRDGAVDLAVTEVDDAVVFQNLGQGDFAPGPRFGIGHGPHDVAVTDLDADGWPDLLTADNNLGNDGTLSVLENRSISAVSRDANGNRIPDECEAVSFHRGDVNGDGILDVSDGLCILAFLFDSGGTPPCREASDANNDGKLDCSDSIVILGYLFLGTRAPITPGPPPSPCGPDTDPAGSSADLGFESYTHCQ